MKRAPVQDPNDESRRYRDPASQRWIVKVLPGGKHVASRAGGELIATVLGSCVAACLYDDEAGIGGMNHFMLPHDDEGIWTGASLALRYGNHAMDALLNEMLNAGAEKSRVVCKFFGGGNVMKSMRGIGDLNASFAREYAAAENLNVISFDLGGTRGRRIMFDPVTGRAWRRLLTENAGGELARTESKLMTPPSLRKPDDSIELF
jgi:chemotaxis protein CheD